MTDEDILIYRKMLGILLEIGPQGLEEPALKEQAEIAAQRLLTTNQLDLAVRGLRERGWIASYRNEVTKRVRWYATEIGKVALAAL